MSKTITVPSHVEMDIRRPTGQIETVIRKDISVFTARDFGLVKAATAKAGRGECIAYRCVTKEVEDTVSNDPSRQAELQYIAGQNAVMRASACGEKSDQIGHMPEDNTPANKTDY